MTTTVPTRGGPALPVTIKTDHKAQGRVAISVYGFANEADAVAAGFKAQSGPAMPIYIVTAAELAAGVFVQEGDPKSTPIYTAPAGMATEGDYATPVILVGGSLSPTPVTPTYQQKVVALGPIAYWPLKEPVGTSGAGSVKDVSGNHRNATPDNVTFGVAGIGDGNTAVSLPGVVASIDIFSASLAAAFTGGEFTVAGWFKVTNLGVWSDGTYRALFHLKADNNNYLLLDKSGAVANNLRIIYVAAGGAAIITFPTASPVAYFHIAVAVSRIGNFVKVYINGVDQVLGLTSPGIWAGNLTAGNAVIGAQDLSGTSIWDGSISNAAIFNGALTAPQIASLATV